MAGEPKSKGSSGPSGKRRLEELLKDATDRQRKPQSPRDFIHKRMRELEAEHPEPK